MIEYIDPAPTFARAVKHNGVIYFSGHVDGQKHDTIAGQTKALCERYEQLLEQGGDKEALLRLCHVLVDGPFVLAERSLSLRFRGSKNQRIIDVQRSLAEGHVVLMQDGRWQ